MSEELERRYRRRMRFYPAAYRRERSDEIVDVLMQGSAPDQSRPGWPDTRALIVGGLSARAGVDQQRSIGVNLRLIGRLTVALFAASWAVNLLTFQYEFHTLPWLPPEPFTRVDAQAVGWGVAWLLLAALLFTRSVRTTLAAVGATAAVAFIDRDMAGDWHQYVVPVAVLGLVALTVRYRSDPRTPPAWAWLVVANVVIQYGLEVLLFGPPHAWTPIFAGAILAFVQSYALLIVVLIWSLVDARPAVAVMLYFIGGMTYRIAIGDSTISDHTERSGMILLGVIAVATVAAVVRMRRQARV